MRVNADTDRCVGAGQCVLTDPELFDQDEEDGTVLVLAEQVSGTAADRARDAVDLCPSGALSIVDG